MHEVIRVIAWADAGQEPFVREAAAQKGLRIVAIGSASTATAADLARDLNAEKCDDLRQAIAKANGDVIWLAGAEHVDRDVLRMIGDSGLPAFTCHPQPGALGEFSAGAAGALPRFVPLMRRTAGFRSAAQIMDDFGEVRALNISFRSGRMHGGGLFGRLYDAMDVVDELCGQPIVLEAGLAGEAPPETLGGLHGHMTINMRFAESRCACAALSDEAGAWFRGVTALGDAGCLRISDGGFEWLDPDGEVVDSQGEERMASPGVLAAEQIVRAMGHRDVSEVPPRSENHARLLGLCEAARLSSRTGQGEAPRKVLEMLSRP